MQQRLPDTLIARALRRLPPAAYALEGPRTERALIQRRQALPALADHWYTRLARHAVVGGTAQPERFVIQRFADSTVVAVYAGAATVPYYRRAFLPSETKSIQLEGLGGDDVFVVEEHGARPASRPRLRIYGGDGNDVLQAGQRHSGVRFTQGSAPEKHAYDKLPKE